MSKPSRSPSEETTLPPAVSLLWVAYWKHHPSRYLLIFRQVLKYIELALSFSFSLHSLRISFQPPEGSMMIDLSTIQSLELIQNLRDARSTDCLFGLLNETFTPMGARLLRSNVLQPLTDSDVLKGRYDALEELTTKENMFFATRQGLSLNLRPRAF